MYIPFTLIIAIVVALLWQEHKEEQRKRDEEVQQAKWARNTGNWRDSI